MKVLVMLSMVLVAARAQLSGQGSDEVAERPRVLCGRVLADARLLYCFSSETQKRSPASSLIVSLTLRRNSALWPWLARRYLGQHQALALRGKRDPGLVDECCLKPCYISELLNYC